MIKLITCLLYFLNEPNICYFQWFHCLSFIYFGVKSEGHVPWFSRCHQISCTHKGCNAGFNFDPLVVKHILLIFEALYLSLSSNFTIGCQLKDQISITNEPSCLVFASGPLLEKPMLVMLLQRLLLESPYLSAFCVCSLDPHTLDRSRKVGIPHILCI